MKILKRIFYLLMVLIIAICGLVLVCAINPELTKSLSVSLYGNDNVTGLFDVLGIGKDKEEDSDTPDGTVQGSNVGAGSTGTVGGSTVTIPTDYVYDVPDGGAVITLPEGVSELTGLMPVSGEGEQITDSVAEDIKSNITQGNTGKDLVFDTTIYPFYGMLSEDEKAVYRQIYANAVEVNSSFAPVKAITTEQLKNIFEAVTNDHPELFYLETEYSVKYTKSGSVVEIVLSYYTIANDIATAREEFDQAANKILAGTETLSDNYSKERYLHDALISNVKYNANAKMNQSAYSALVNGETVCAGYARALQYMMQKLGIPCYYCTGYSGEDHAWNIVMLDDGYYNVDVTWDDTDPSTYDYFNRSDSDFSPTHRRTGLSVYLPACKGKAHLGPVSDNPNTVDLDGNGSYTEPESHQEPLKYEDPEDNTGSGNESGAGAIDTTIGEALAALGLVESDVLWTMEDYYEDCKVQLVVCGTGDQHFTNIVPAALFDKIVAAYGTGDYEEGYVNSALKTLNMDHFSIQIQAQKLGNGYYKLYHNVVTWKE